MVKFPPETSVFTGECYGIFKCLEYILLLKLKKSVIFSDSKSALQALAKYPFKSNNCYPIILDCRKLLNRCISMGLQVALVWIPGHANIAGNVKADHVANEAVCSGDIFPYKNYAHDLAALPKTYLYDSWTQDWNSSSQVKGKLYKQIQPSIPVKPCAISICHGNTLQGTIDLKRLQNILQENVKSQDITSLYYSVKGLAELNADIPNICEILKNIKYDPKNIEQVFQVANAAAITSCQNFLRPEILSPATQTLDKKDASISDIYHAVFTLKAFGKGTVYDKEDALKNLIQLLKKDDSPAK
ncbi:hypothetical protein HF086_006614 [Spodoptera exigua]|uniref:Dolichyl-diphosphooligosaccharide--protein glycosyltransferase subunit 2 n=1 Tax=Spodoptera exigua TaxID=7107 RepID=A0A922SBG0_SPOEX|nr:hypothetical protein HF086_006614 [Spodoptera exigua]